jgi:hypothetical protein
MVKFVGELLFAIFMREWANSVLLKAGTWLDKKIHGRWTKIALGVLLGLAIYIIRPVCAGLLGF